MSSDILTAVETDQRIAEAKLGTIRADLERRALEESLAESSHGRVVPWQEYPQAQLAAHYADEARPWYLHTTKNDRVDGKCLPYYETEADLRHMRADARSLSAFFELSRGAIDTLANYTLGGGPTVEVIAADPDDTIAAQLARKVQAVVDQFIEDNDFVGGMDREIHRRSREEGESPVALYSEGGRARAVFVEPDYICEPYDPRAIEEWQGLSEQVNFWWHGVHTQYNAAMQRDDEARPLGYYLQYTDDGRSFDYLPNDRLELFKRNTPFDARRGVSDFLPTVDKLRKLDKLDSRIADGAAIQASIALIREHVPGVSAGSVNEYVAGAANSKRTESTHSGGTQTVYGKHFASGQVVDIPSGKKYHASPMGTPQSAVFIEVAAYLRRSIAVRWQMPEYMISSDASNSNFASTLVAESPFVKAREADQAFYAQGFRSLMWKACRIAWEAGALGEIDWDTLTNAVRLTVDLPEVASRDKLQQAQVAAVLRQNRVISTRTWASEAGYDYDDELRELETEPAPEPMGVGVESYSDRLSKAATLLWEGYP